MSATGAAPPRSTLDGKQLAELGRPFSLDAIRYKVLTRAGDDKKAMAAFYMDARLVAERLNYVVGPENWQDEYKPLLTSGVEMAAHYFPVECRLSVFGIEKVDVGVYQRNQPDELAWKSAYSDAFKRVSVKFRVGAYLYAIPKLRVEVNTYEQGGQTKVKGFSRAGEQELRDAYSRWLANENLNVFGAALDHVVWEQATDDPAEDEGIEFPPPRPQ